MRDADRILATATLRQDGTALGVHLGVFTPADRAYHLEACDTRFPYGAPHREVDLVERTAGGGAVDVEWLLTRDTGLSSRAIWCVMNGADPRHVARFDFPSDTADFERCLKLVRRNPQWLPWLGALRVAGPEWAALVDHWDELAALYDEMPEGPLRYRAVTRRLDEIYGHTTPRAATR